MVCNAGQLHTAARAILLINLATKSPSASMLQYAIYPNLLDFAIFIYRD